MADARQEKGRTLAADKRVKRIEGATWFVPSQSKNEGGYLVNVLGQTCSCPDHETRMTKCKHMWAVELSQTVTVEDGADGSRTVTQTTTVRKTYAQDWSHYNEAQCNEKETVQALLRQLCEGIQTPPHPGRGPKPLPLSDAVYGMVTKVWTGLSARRSTGDMRECASKGHIARAPHFNSILNYFEKPEMTALLTALIQDCATPLTSIDTRFAVDSTGFGTVTYHRWYDQKYGREMKQATWLKAHAIVGCTSNVIAAVHVTDSNANDCPELPALVDAVAANGFDMRAVSADKAYLSHANLAKIESVGAIPYIPFKSNSGSTGSEAWRRMWGMFMYRQADFSAEYHKRSLSESAFSSIKRKFGPAVRSKGFVAQVNEVLCKVLAYDLSCLVHAMHQLGVEPTFPGTHTLAVAS
jgi:transposase